MTASDAPTALAWTALAIYVLVAVVLAVRAARRTTSLSAHAVGNRDLPAAVVGLSLAAQLTSVATFVVNPGLVHAFGVSALLGYGVAAGAGICIGLTVLSRRFRSAGVRIAALTIPSWIGKRYGSRWLRALFALLSLGLVAFAVLIVVALALVLAKLTGAPPALFAAGLVVLVLGIVLAGGATAHAWINAVQTSIMLVVALVMIGAALPLLVSGGILDRLRAIDPNLASAVNPASPLFRNFFEVFVANFLVGLAIVCQPHVLSKALYLKDDREVRRYLLVAIGCGVVFMSVLAIGLHARVSLPDTPLRIDNVVPTWLAHTFSGPLRVLVGVGMLCAGLSTLEGIVLALSSILALDVWPLLRPRDEGPGAERRALSFGRAGLVVLGVAVVALSLQQIANPTGGTVAIFAQYGVYLLFTASFLPLACGMFLPKAGTRLVGAGVVAALAGYLLPALFELGPMHNNPAVLATTGILAGWAVVGAGLLAQAFGPSRGARATSADGIPR